MGEALQLFFFEINFLEQPLIERESYLRPVFYFFVVFISLLHFTISCFILFLYVFISYSLLFFINTKN